MEIFYIIKRRLLLIFHTATIHLYWFYVYHILTHNTYITYIIHVYILPNFLLSSFIGFLVQHRPCININLEMSDFLIGPRFPCHNCLKQLWGLALNYPFFSLVIRVPMWKDWYLPVAMFSFMFHRLWGENWDRGRDRGRDGGAERTHENMRTHWKHSNP